MIWEDRWGWWGERGQLGYGSGHGSDHVLGEKGEWIRGQEDGGTYRGTRGDQ
jgi:hypothetical protein